MAGSIIKRDKNKYLVRLYVGIENGKRKYHCKLIQECVQVKHWIYRKKLLKKGKICYLVNID